MSSQLILWPVLAYLGASLLVPRLRGWMSEQTYRFLILLSSVLAFLLTLLAIHKGGAASTPWVLADWEALAGPSGALSFRVDPFAASFLLLTGLVALGVLVGSLDEQEVVASDDYQAGLLSLFAGLSALALADNLLTLLVANLLVDAALIFGIGLTGRPRWLLVAFLHALAAQGAALAALLLLWRDSGSLDLAGASAPAVLLLVAVAVLRMAPLPFSLFPVAFEALPQRVMALLPLVTLGAGSVWLGRVAQAVAVSQMPELGGLAGMAALGVALAGWVAWRREEPTVRLIMLGAVQAAWSLWAFAWGLPAAAVAVAWGGALALAALAIHGGRLDFRHGAQLLGLIAALVLVGFPGSALWGVATALSGQALVRDESWLLALGVIGIMTNTAALTHWLIPDTTEPYRRARWPGAILLSLLSVPVLALLWGIRVPAWEQLPLPAAPLVAQLALLVIGWSGGLLLWRDRQRFHSLQPLLDSAGALFSFAWLWRIVGWLGWLLLSGVRGMMLVLEGENYGWLLLFLFLTFIFLLPR